jgi:hypothetical protein
VFPLAIVSLCLKLWLSLVSDRRLLPLPCICCAIAVPLLRLYYAFAAPLLRKFLGLATFEVSSLSVRQSSRLASSVFFLYCVFAAPLACALLFVIGARRTSVFDGRFTCNWEDLFLSINPFAWAYLFLFSGRVGSIASVIDLSGRMG